VVAAVTAGVGLALILLALLGTNLLRDLLLSTRWGGAVAVVANSLLAAAAALCAWVLFYALRLADRSGRITPGDAGGNLRKLRAGTCILLVTSLALVTIGGTGDGPMADLALAVPACLASAACCYVLVSLRRLAWDVALAEGAVIARPGGGRGFAVLSPYAPPQAAAMPVASAPDLPAPHHGAAVAPPLEEGSAFREWETLLTVLAVLAMAVYVFRTPAAVAFIAAIVDRPQALPDLVLAAIGGGTSSGAREPLRAWIVLASLGLALCAVAWVF
jgi:hypothetical protein